MTVAHATQVAQPAEIRVCEGCGTPFERLRKDGRPPKYCSIPCRTRASNESLRKINGDPQTCWPRSAETEARVCALYLSGLSASSVAGRYSVSGETISRVLRRNGIQKRLNTAPTMRKRRNGGRHRDRHGYMYLLIDPSDPLYEMTQSYGGISKGNARYALEHRIVMARIIGRPLKPFEHVHHINGHRDDNRPENLELWAKPSRAGLSRRQPNGQRVTDLITFVTENYPEMVRAALAM